MMSGLFILFSIIVFFGTFFNPFIGLFGSTVMLFLMPHIFSMVFVKLHFTRLMGILTLASLLMHKRKTRAVDWFRSPQSKWMLKFILVMVLSMSTSIWRGNTYGAIINFMKMVIAYFLVINLIDTIPRFRLTVWAMILSVLYLNVTSIHAYYQNGGFGRMATPFYGTNFSDPNDLAMSFVFMLPFLFLTYSRTNKFLIFFLRTAIIIAFFWGIILTQSRGGLVGLCVMMVVLWLRSEKKILFSAIIILFLAGGWALAPQDYKDRMMTIKTAGEEDAAAISRMDAWKAGLNMMTHRVFGVGMGNFGEGFVVYRPPGAVDVPGMRRVAHNMFIQVGGETGFPGLFVYLMLIGSSFRALKRIRKETKQKMDARAKELRSFADATYVSLIGFCSAGMFLSQSYTFALYYLIGFSVVLEKICSKET